MRYSAHILPSQNQLLFAIQEGPDALRALALTINWLGL
jgi:hypothetical protein